MCTQAPPYSQNTLFEPVIIHPSLLQSRKDLPHPVSWLAEPAHDLEFRFFLCLCDPALLAIRHPALRFDHTPARTDYVPP